MAKAFFHIQAEDNPVGARRIELNREAMRFYRDVVAQADLQTTDIETLADQLDADDQTLTSFEHEKLLGFVVRVAEQLPKLAPIAYDQGLISECTAYEIESAFQALPLPPGRHLTTLLEQALVTKFTPLVPDQYLPSATSLGDLIRRYVHNATPPDAPKPPRPNYLAGPNYKVSRSGMKGIYLVIAEVDQPTSEAIDRHINAYAEANDVSTIDALYELVCGTGEPKTANIFGLGTLKPNTSLVVNELEASGRTTDQQPFEQLPPSYRNILDIAFLQHDSSTPTPEQKFITHERDGFCRYPGCKTYAEECAVDYVIPFNAGGQTTLGNLISLCRDHYKMKADQKVHVEMTPDGAATWRSTKRLGATVPEGPLAGLTGRADSNTRLNTRRDLDQPTTD
ncbi:MAG: HNH endonuclease signature motif containing protein [Corynebacterium sp.]|nr:HNH endonuclease signature motif containing protein [Corynebacterium sp.]